MKHHYDIILALDIGKVSPEIGEFMDRVNSTFQAIAGEPAGKVVLEGPIELTMTTKEILSEEAENLVIDAIKEKIKGTEFRFERLKYIGVA